MNILDNMVLPSSGEHLEVYSYLLMLGLLLFLSYSAVFFGSSLLSVMLRRMGTTQSKADYIRLGQDYADIITTSKLSGVSLGLIPFVAVILLYSQLLHTTDTGIAVYLVVSLILYMAGWVCIYVYRHTIHLEKVFNTFKKTVHETDDETDVREFLNFNKSNARLNIRSGIWGVALQFLSLWILIGCFSLAADPQRWSETTNIFSVIFYMSGFVKFVQYQTAAIAIAGGYLLYIRYYSDSDKKVETDSSYDTFVRRLNSSMALILILVQPVFFIMNVMLTPSTAVSYSLFIITIIALGAVFAGSHFLYGILKENRKRYISFSFYSMIAVLGFFIIQEQTDFHIANRAHELTLAANYEKHVQQEMEKLGLSNVKLDGNEIFTARCSPCHAFDRQITGPAYNTVLGKYVGNKQKLVQFIMNPVKMNPALPPMPNPGLKPNEADAVADFLLKTFQSSGQGKK